MGPLHDFALSTSAWRAKRRLGSVAGSAALMTAARVEGKVLDRRVRARV